MERLIMDPTALGDRAALGQPMRTLPERIMRRPQQGAGNAPRWAAPQSAQPAWQPAPDPATQNGHGARTRIDSAAGYPGDTYYGPRSS
jgi:hypothetical protein